MSQEANGQWACLFPFPCAEVWELAHRLDRLAAGVQATDTGVKGSDQIHKVAGLHLLRLIFAKQLKKKKVKPFSPEEPLYALACPQQTPKLVVQNGKGFIATFKLTIPPKCVCCLEKQTDITSPLRYNKAAQ